MHINDEVRYLGQTWTVYAMDGDCCYLEGTDHEEQTTAEAEYLEPVRACESAIEGQAWIAGFAEGDDLIVIQHSGEDIDLISIPGEGTVSALIRYEPVDGESWEPEVYDAALAEAGWQRVGGWLRNRTEMRLRRTVR